MTTEFLGGEVWPQLTDVVRGSRLRCFVAVAYLGAGASRLLPLRKGSHLVVDASERAVASGQTCPSDLQKLMNRGVAIYSVPNLHAKVFVVGRAAYIGSTNVSARSASQLIEAAIRTTEPSAVRAAREFVEDHCLHEMTPDVLKRLAKLYRPPKVTGGRTGKKQIRREVKETSQRPTLPRVLFAQLERERWTDRDASLHEEGLAVAKKRRQHSGSFELDSFRWAGKCPYKRGDVVVQVTNEDAGRFLVSPPANILHVGTRRFGARLVSFVYVEQPVRRRLDIKVLARTVRCPQRRLRGNGLIRERAFVRALLNAWAMTK
jgi:hypothetical protein